MLSILERVDRYLVESASIHVIKDGFCDLFGQTEFKDSIHEINAAQFIVYIALNLVSLNSDCKYLSTSI